VSRLLREHLKFILGLLISFKRSFIILEKTVVVNVLVLLSRIRLLANKSWTLEGAFCVLPVLVFDFELQLLKYPIVTL